MTTQVEIDPWVDRHLAIGTGHIHPQDAERLYEGSSHLNVSTTEEGWILYVGHGPEYPWRVVKGYDLEGWKTDFEAIARAAWARGCSRVTFDANCGAYADLEIYDW